MQYAFIVNHINTNCVLYACTNNLYIRHVGRSSDEYVDKTLVKDLTSDQDALIAKQEAKAEKKQRKAQQKLKERLKAERSKGGNNNDAAEDDDDQLIANFAKTKTKKKR